MAKEAAPRIDPRGVLARKERPTQDGASHYRRSIRGPKIVGEQRRLRHVDRLVRRFDVDPRAGGELEPVAAGRRGQGVPAETDLLQQAAQLADDRAQGQLKGRGRLSRPQAVDQLVSRHWPAALEREVREQAASLAPRQAACADQPPILAQAHVPGQVDAQHRQSFSNRLFLVWDSPAHRDAAVRKEELEVAVTITIRARLKAEPATIQAIHDQVTGATKEMARQAGDISHIVYLDPQDRRQFLGIDTWQSAEQAQAFAGSPQIQEFFGQMFEGQPEVKVWVDPGWNKW